MSDEEHKDPEDIVEALAALDINIPPPVIAPVPVVPVIAPVPVVPFIAPPPFPHSVPGFDNLLTDISLISSNINANGVRAGFVFDTRPRPCLLITYPDGHLTLTDTADIVPFINDFLTFVIEPENYGRIQAIEVAEGHARQAGHLHLKFFVDYMLYNDRIGELADARGITIRPDVIQRIEDESAVVVANNVWHTEDLSGIAFQPVEDIDTPTAQAIVTHQTGTGLALHAVPTRNILLVTIEHPPLLSDMNAIMTTIATIHGILGNSGVMNYWMSIPIPEAVGAVNSWTQARISLMEDDHAKLFLLAPLPWISPPRLDIDIVVQPNLTAILVSRVPAGGNRGGRGGNRGGRGGNRGGRRGNRGGRGGNRGGGGGRGRGGI